MIADERTGYLSRIEELLSNKNPSDGKVLVKLDVGSRSTKIKPQIAASKNKHLFETPSKKKEVDLYLEVKSLTLELAFVVFFGDSTEDNKVNMGQFLSPVAPRRTTSSVNGSTSAEIKGESSGETAHG